MTTSIKLIIILTGIIYCFTACAQNAKFEYDPESYICYRASETLDIDGKIDEADWEKAPWTADFVDIEGDIRPKPLHRTRVKMLWDSEYFYVAAEMIEPHIWATYTKRDAVIYHENDFEVFIDPDGDTHNYYELEINALGTVWDLLLIKPYRDGAPAINGWDINGLKKGINIKGTINDPSDTDEKWTVELAFPWEILKEAAFESRMPKDGEQWRVNFSRVNWKMDFENGRYSKLTDPSTGKSYPEFNWVWSAQGVIAMHQPETWGFVQFSDNHAGEKVEFHRDPDDKIKWLLRNLYYAQHEYRSKNNAYTTDPEKLDHNKTLLEELNEKPRIQITTSSFEILCKGSNNRTWHISEDGRVWQTIETKDLSN